MGKFDQEVAPGRIARYVVANANRRRANLIIKDTLEQGSEAMDNHLQPALIADYLNVQHERVSRLLRGNSYDAAGAR